MEMGELDNLLNRLMELYQIVLANQKKKLQITPEIEGAIRILINEIHQISEITDIEVEKAGMDKADIKKVIYDPNATAPVEVKKIMKKSLYLKKELEGCRNVLKNISKSHKKGISQSDASKKRQDKFKNIGAKKGWIPL